MTSQRFLDPQEYKIKQVVLAAKMLEAAQVPSRGLGVSTTYDGRIISFRFVKFYAQAYLF